MDARSEIREFLTSRRARITPEQAGLRTYGGTRRVPGLRREEVALLAGVSVDYYTRLERGNASGVSENVLEALARALQLDEAERAHLLRPRARRAADDAGSPSRRAAADPAGRAAHARRDDGAPAFVRNGRLDILAANRLGRALYAEQFESPRRSRRTPPASSSSTARAPTFYSDWERVANDVVAVLRAEAGRDPYDRDLSDLVGELSTRSELFRTLWAAHNVRRHDAGVKRFHHPVVGELRLDVRGDGARRRSRADDVRLHRRARLELRGGACDCSRSWTATVDAAELADVVAHDQEA